MARLSDRRPALAQAAVAALAVLILVVVIGCVALYLLVPDRPRVPPGAELSDPEAIMVTDGNGFLNFAGTTRDHRYTAYARQDDAQTTVVVADAVTARPLATREIDWGAQVKLGWNGRTLELRVIASGGCRADFTAGPPEWRFERSPCGGENPRERAREQLPPAPLDLRPVTQCDPHPTVKAPARPLWAVEVCSDQGLREPDFVWDIRLVDVRGRFVAQLADLYAPAWAADGSLLAVADGQRLVRVPGPQIDRLSHSSVAARSLRSSTR